MEEWKIYKLSEIITLIGGGTPKTTIKEFWDGNIPWLSVKDFNNNEKYVYSTEKSITQQGLDNSSTKLLKKDDIIISARGTVGEMAMIPFPMTFNQSCYAIRGSDDVNQHFLYYLIKYKIGEIKSKTHGSVFDTITKDTFESIICEIPSIYIQNQIANFLSSIDDKIALNTRINDNLEQQAQAIYRSWFVDFEPFKGGKFVDSELGKIPAGWRVVELDSIVDISKMTINPLRYPDTYFTHYSLPACDNAMNPEIQLGGEIMSNKIILSDNTILFSKLNPRIKRIWFTHIVKEHSVCSTEFIPYRAKDKKLYSYVYSILNSDSFYNSIMSFVNGATGSHQRFHPENTLKLKYAVKNNVLESFCSLVNPMLKKMHSLRDENIKLAKLRDSLLPKLMSGELNINNM